MKLALCRIMHTNTKQRERWLVAAVAPLVVERRIRVYEQILARIQDLTLRGNVFLTTHAEEEMAADDLTIHDIEATILSGRITGRQRDAFEYKYVIVGQTTALEEATVVCKIIHEVVVITIFLGTP